MKFARVGLLIFRVFQHGNNVFRHHVIFNTSELDKTLVRPRPYRIEIHFGRIHFAGVAFWDFLRFCQFADCRRIFIPKRNGVVLKGDSAIHNLEMVEPTLSDPTMVNWVASQLASTVCLGRENDVQQTTHGLA